MGNSLIDADSQGDLTASLGIQEPDELDITLTDIMTKVINGDEIDPKYGVVKHPEGVLVTMVDNRINNSKEIRKLLVENYVNKVQIFKRSIPMAVKTAEAPAAGVGVCEYDPHGNATKAYESLVKEIIGNE